MVKFPGYFSFTPEVFHQKRKRITIKQIAVFHAQIKLDEKFRQVDATQPTWMHCNAINFTQVTFSFLPYSSIFSFNGAKRKYYQNKEGKKN